jgi:hypothetical protein
MKTRYMTAAACTVGILFASCSTSPPAVPSTAAKENPMPAKVYEALRLYNDKAAEKLGRIAIDAGKLSIVSLIDDSKRERVQKSLDDLNNRPFLAELVPPKDGERYDLGAKEYHRGESGFDEMLIRELELSHAIRLEATK